MVWWLALLFATAFKLWSDLKLQALSEIQFSLSKDDKERIFHLPAIETIYFSCCHCKCSLVSYEGDRILAVKLYLETNMGKNKFILTAKRKDAEDPPLVNLTTVTF